MSDRTHNHTPRMGLEIQEFLLERRIRRVSKRTLAWHQKCLERFSTFCYSNNVTETKQITAALLRHFVLELEEAGHNEGGIANIYRSIKAYLNWYEIEYEGSNWKNPVKKVKVANNKIEPLEPVSIEHFNALLATCERKTLTGDRDRSILMMLLDTGIRKAEITALALSDLNLNDGSVLIRNGKGGKSRTVFIGATTRRALMAYLRQRESFLAYLADRSKARQTEALWISGKDGKKLRYDGIREIIRRRAADAGIPEPSPHSFRRAFARNAWLQGMDIIALQRLLGHSSLAVINRYIKSFDDDLRVAHEQFGVVDNL